ncbi:hypothetical protein SAMN05216486_10112 [bacterium JGI 053]|nr:hypothetical protein SAMN05216486_10112 [bacterium JGI 053]
MKFLLPLVFSAAVVVAGCEATSPTAVAPARSPAAPSFTGTGACAPPGVLVISPGWYYQWIANGTPTSTNCWSPGYGDAVVTATACNDLNTSALEFGYAGGISQEFTIPTDQTAPNFDFSYYLDFVDPNHDGAWNRFTADLVDVTTGVTIYSELFFGNGTQPGLCSHRGKTFVGNYAGHTFQLRLSGSRAYTDTHIRVRSITLIQSL